jgi:hypothetical protein
MSKLFKGASANPSIPRGIEALVKKASVDPDFRKNLLENRAKAAVEIGLELSAAEKAMLKSIPEAQIEQIIESVTVPDEHRRVFLGKIASAMLAVLALGLPGCGESDKVSRREMTHGPREDDQRQSRSPGFALVPIQHELLKIEVLEKGTGAMSAKVGHVCPFEKGEIRVMFPDGARVTCEPEHHSVTAGRGAVTFSTNASKERTGRIIAVMHSTDWSVEGFPVTDFLRLPVGEYRFQNTFFCEVIAYPK